MTFPQTKVIIYDWFHSRWGVKIWRRTWWKNDLSLTRTKRRDANDELCTLRPQKCLVGVRHEDSRLFVTCAFIHTEPIQWHYWSFAVPNIWVNPYEERLSNIESEYFLNGCVLFQGVLRARVCSQYLRVHSKAKRVHWNDRPHSKRTESGWLFLKV